MPEPRAPAEQAGEPRFALRLDQEECYRFRVRFAVDDLPDMVVDELQPLGGSAGPAPTHMLAAAVGHCLSASLQFCLSKSRIEGVQIHTQVEGSLRRNASGRWRIDSLDVRLEVGNVDTAVRGRLDRCLGLFEDFCIVTASVRDGLAVNVEVTAEI